MKKIFSFLLVLSLALSILVGCSSNGSNEITPEVEDSSEEVLADVSIEDTPEESESNEGGDKVPKEYQSALKKADLYANEMHMSKVGLYDQLVSEYGENFSEEAAQYAVDNVKADWKENALQKAIIYQEEMAMSPNAIYDQLVSEHGESFTEEEAQYAIDKLPE